MLAGILRSSIITASIYDNDVISAFIAPVQIISNQPSYVQDTMNLRRRASSQGVQRWEISAGLSPQNNSAFNLIHSAMNSNVTRFYIRMPQVVNLDIGNNKTIEQASNTQLADSVGRNQSTITTQSRLTEGEFINIGDANKVYLVVKVDGTTSTIIPPAMMSAAAATSIKRGGNVKMYARYDSDTQLGITYTDGILSDPGVVKFIEAI